MHARLLLCFVASLLILGFAGCTDGDAPTEPRSGLSLNGAWTGTLTHYDSLACAREAISLTLAQEGTTVTTTFPTGCRGMLDLRAAVSGDAVVGELYRSVDGLRIGQISGAASRTRIHITTWQPHTREEHEPPTRTVINVIDLTR
jgi:hypothetical protein